MKPYGILFWILTFLLTSCSDKITNVTPGPSFDLGPYVSDSATRALWHFDELSGDTVADFSAYQNTGTAVAATIGSGKYGNSRTFNGTSSYVSFPSDSSFNLDTLSFTMDVWFKTTTTKGAFLLRRGLAPVAGYLVAINGGRVQGMIGNRGDSSWPDTLISLTSDSTFNDDQWHCVSFVRDRGIRKLLLYVDGKLATQPVDDNFTLPLENDRPLTIGRWENDMYPDFFVGSLDEVRIKRGVHH